MRPFIFCRCLASSKNLMLAIVISCPKWTLIPVFLASERTSACSLTDLRSHVPAFSRPSASFRTADRASGLASISERDRSLVTIALMSLSGSGCSIFNESAKRVLTSSNCPTMLLAVAQRQTFLNQIMGKHVSTPAPFLYVQKIGILRHMALLGTY